MDARVRSLLYDEPRLYDLVFPDPGDTMGRMCREAFTRYLSPPAESVLDIGCGTGRLLESLAATVGECWGVDYAESNVEEVEDYAEYRLLYPEELRGFLEAAGFEILGMYDNRDFRATDLTGHAATASDVGGMGGRKLYTFAVKL